MDAVADIVAPEATDSFYNSSAFFNASLKLAHRFFSLPSRALARLRRLDDVSMDLHDAAHHSAYSSTNGNGQRRSRTSVHDGPPIPGMWGFLTSGYFVGLFIMVSTHTQCSSRGMPLHAAAIIYGDFVWEMRLLPKSLRHRLGWWLPFSSSDAPPPLYALIHTRRS